MHDTIVVDPTGVEQGFGEALAEVYDGGAEWDRHKALTQRKAFQAALWEALGYGYAGQVRRCSSTLVLRRDPTTGELGVRPFETCKKRWCPVCEWRKSLKRWALLVERLPGLVQQHGPVKWLLLTLTVRNCAIDDLPGTVTAMAEGWRRLTAPRTALGRQWPATAWIKALELTFPRPGEAHPHYHVLLAVQPGYFSGGRYITQAEWARRWKQAMRLDYDPIVDIRRVKPLSPAVAQSIGVDLAEALGGLREVSKYVTKPGDAETVDALRGLLLLRYRRFIDSGGWLRGVLSEKMDDDAQMDLPEMEDVATFWWRAVEEKYRRKL